MRAKIRTKCRRCAVAKRDSGCLSGGDEIMRALDALTGESAPAQHPIEEQLKQCPDAFKVGELMEKMFAAVHRTHEERSDRERLLPPPGAVIPPLV